MPARLAVVLARIRLSAVAMFLAMAVAARFVPVLDVGWPFWLVGAALIVFLLRAGTVRREAIPVLPPVMGSWRALNSPATRVPSHGTQGYGQAHAIDLVCEQADDRRRPGFAWWPLARRPDDFPGFGQRVLAPGDGVVVRVHDSERDHWSRTSPWGLLYLVTIELLRELFGPNRVVGNHVIIDLGGGVYAALAHLRHGSVLVSVGDHVRAGDQVAECGNSGNTTEPHLHFQLMDHRRVGIAAGLPFCFLAPDGTELRTPPNGALLAVRGPASSELARDVEARRSWT